MATKRVSKGLLSAAGLHWFTFYAHVHGKLPFRADDYEDEVALRYLCAVDALGDRDRALRVIEAVIRAPIPGNSLATRYEFYWVWIEQGRPKRYRAPNYTLLLDVRRCIRSVAA